MWLVASFLILFVIIIIIIILVHRFIEFKARSSSLAHLLYFTQMPPIKPKFQLAQHTPEGLRPGWTSGRLTWSCLSTGAGFNDLTRFHPALQCCNVSPQGTKLWAPQAENRRDHGSCSARAPCNGTAGIDEVRKCWPGGGHCPRFWRCFQLGGWLIVNTGALFANFRSRFGFHPLFPLSSLLSQNSGTFHWGQG